MHVLKIGPRVNALRQGQPPLSRHEVSNPQVPTIWFFSGIHIHMSTFLLASRPHYLHTVQITVAAARREGPERTEKEKKKRKKTQKKNMVRQGDPRSV